MTENKEPKAINEENPMKEDAIETEDKKISLEEKSDEEEMKQQQQQQESLKVVKSCERVEEEVQVNLEREISDEEQRQLQQFQNEIDLENLNDIEELKSILLNLQSLFMQHDINLIQDCNSVNSKAKESAKGDDANDISIDNEYLATLTKEEQISVLKSKIQQLELLCKELKQELNILKSNLVNNNGLQHGLKSRINQQNNTILEMKNEELKLNLNCEKLLNDKNELELENEELKRRISRLKSTKQEAEEVQEERKDEQKMLLLKTANQIGDENLLRESLEKLKSIVGSNQSAQHLILNVEREFLALLNERKFQVATNGIQNGNASSTIVQTSATNNSNNINNSNGGSITSTSVSSLVSSSGSSSLTSSSANSPVLSNANSQSSTTKTSSNQQQQQQIQNKQQSDEETALVESSNNEVKLHKFNFLN